MVSYNWFALDIVSAAMLLGLAGFFAVLWVRSRDTLPGLFAVGFALVGLGFPTVAASQSRLLDPAGTFDALRLASQTGGALILALAYLSARLHGSPRPVEVAAWAVAALCVGFALVYLVIPPIRALPRLDHLLGAGHAVMVACYAACTLLSAASFRHGARLELGLVPAGFLALAFAKYTWLLGDLGATSVSGLAYSWRLVGLVLLILAAVTAGRGARGPA